MKVFTAFLFLFVLPVMAFGQSKPKAPAPVCSALPTVGTRIVNTYYVLDSSGTNITDTVPDGRLPNDTNYVIQSGITYAGRSKVIVTTGPAHEDTTYLSYADNGDVYLLNTARVGRKWERLPFGMKPGKVITTKPVLDTGTLMGRSYAMLNSTSTQVLGWDTASVAGKPVPVVHLRITSYTKTDKRMRNMPYAEFTNATNYWYAPSIGYFARINFGWGGTYFMNQQVLDYQPK